MTCFLPPPVKRLAQPAFGTTAHGGSAKSPSRTPIGNRMQMSTAKILASNRIAQLD